ncbi:MAG: tetratricopeptide repeat protein [candidate division WOR-3 bacterium]
MLKRFKTNAIFLLLFPFFVFAYFDYFYKAKNKFDQRLYSEAIFLLEKELQMNPQNGPAWKLLGQCFSMIEDESKAIMALKKAKALVADPTIDQLLQEVTRRKKEKLESLIAQYTNYSLRYPKDNEARLKLTQLYKEYQTLTSGQTESATDFAANRKKVRWVKESKENKRGVESYLNQNPTSNDLLNRARTLVGQEAYPLAESLYEVYLRKNPLDTTAWGEYAAMLSWAGKYEKSIIAYRQLLTLNPNDQKSALELARVLSWSGAYDSAIHQYLKLDTTDLKVLTGLAETYYWQGNNTGALAIYEKILEKDPKNLTALKRQKELKAKIIGGPQFQASGNSLWDNEDFSLKRFSANLQLNLSTKTALEPGFAYCEFKQQEDYISAYSYSIRLIEKFSESVWGVVRYTYNFYDCLDNTHSYGIKFDYTPYPNSNFNFSYDHYDIINDVLTTRSLIQGITTDNFLIQGYYQFEKNYGLFASYLYGSYSDLNQLQNPQAKIFYKMFHILTLGYRYNLITYSDTSHYYWSPDFYQTHSLWIELANGSQSPLSYYVSLEIAKVTNLATWARAIVANFALNPPKTKLVLGIQFSYSDTRRTLPAASVTAAPAYWYQSLTAYLKLGL